MDDLWHSPATLSSETALQFFENTVITEIDPLQCFQGYYAPYWKMGSFFGFREVSPLMEWVNNNRIDLVFERGVKSVTFEAIHQNHDTVTSQLIKMKYRKEKWRELINI